MRGDHSIKDYSMQQQEFSASQHMQLVGKSVTLLRLSQYSPLLFYKVIKHLGRGFFVAGGCFNFCDGDVFGLFVHVGRYR